MPDRLITIDELIELLGERSRQAIYNKLNRGVLPIPTLKVGRSLRWRLSDVVAYIERLEPVN